MRISDWSSDVCSADLLAEFSTLPFGCTDPEDIAVDPLSGNLFIIGELTRTIYETTQAGELVSSIALPDKLKRPEAVAYDADFDMFYVSGGWTEIGRASCRERVCRYV